MDKLDKNKIDELLPRYCEGQVTEEERLLVETWMNESESCWEMDFTMCKAAAIVNCKSVSALPRFVSGWW